MTKRLLFYGLLLVLVSGVLNNSCVKEPVRPVFPLSADIFFSVDDKKVAFTGLTHSATQWQWDFGDGNTSTEQNPVHEYADGGYYTATLTASNPGEGSVTAEVQLAIALTPYVLLTGGPTNPDGKTWKINAAHGPNDILANSDKDLSLLDPSITSLPSGAFGLYLGLGEIYEQEFTFRYDGKFSVKPVNGSVFGGIVYAYVAQQMGLATITKAGGEAVFGADVFAMTTYTDPGNLTFEFKENEDYTLYSAFPTGVIPPGIPVTEYKDVTTIDVSQGGFIGVRDFHSKVIVQAISDKSMRLVMFITLSPDAIVSQSPLIVLATSAVVLSFEVVE